MSDYESITSTAPLVRYAEIKPGYCVGDDGTVWSCWKRLSLGRGYGTTSVLSNQWHQLKPRPNHSGHMQVDLGWHDRRIVHRLVLESFVGPCPPGMEACHWDGDPGNNKLTNLRWDTRKANAADMVRHGTVLAGEKANAAVLTEAAVLEVVAMGRAGKSQRSIARFFGVGQSTIRRILRGQTWSHLTGIPSPARRV